MFAVGDYILYGVEGVCRVEEVGYLNIPGIDRTRQYYSLRPCYHEGAVYTPIDGKAAMRQVITRQELDELMPSFPTLPLLDNVPPGAREAGVYYKNILTSHDCRMLFRLCKTISRKQSLLSPSRRNLSSTELRSLRAAEELLYGEIAFVLGLTPEAVRERMKELLENS